MVDGKLYEGICSKCLATHHITAEVWRQGRKPTCRHCGGSICPPKVAVEEFGLDRFFEPKRVCLMCGAKLRHGNDGELCNMCAWSAKMIRCEQRG